MWAQIHFQFKHDGKKTKARTEKDHVNFIKIENYVKCQEFEHEFESSFGVMLRL